MRSRIGDGLRAAWDWLRRHPLLATALIIAGAAIDAFFELAEELPEGDLGAFDRFVVGYIQHFQTHGVLLFSLLMSDLLLFPFVIFMLLPFLVYLLATRRYVLAIGLALIPSVTGLIIVLLKSIYRRHRPTAELVMAGGYSFPSGHAFSSVVIYGLLGYIVWRCFTHNHWQRVLTAIVVVLLVLATGFARVDLGVHYPSDVVGGWAAGTAVLIGSIALLQGLQRRWK